MIKIPIITQNFSSPDVYADTPLMLLPQSLPPSLPDRDQEGFSQLLLHDLHRHRQSYVRSYTAFETLKKRQDFVLRQENLRSLVNFEQRITAKQDQFIDQSIHSYEQCFVKVINGDLIPNGHLSEPQKRIKGSTPSFDKYHIHQLSHATPLDPPPIIPFHRYQKSHRPPLLSKYRSYTDLNRSAQSLHDAFQSSNFSNRSQPFISFTESYFQKYGDRSLSGFDFTTNNARMNGIKQQQDDGEGQRQQQIRSTSSEPNLITNQNKKQDQKSKTSDLQRTRANASSRTTNTPSSTPRMNYNDAIRDGLTSTKGNTQNQLLINLHFFHFFLLDNQDHTNKIFAIIEKRRSSQQSTSQQSDTDNKTNTKRSKTDKKKQLGGSLTPDKKPDSLITQTTDDLLKTAMFVQNYENNLPNQNLSTKIERVQLPTTPTITIRKTPSNLHPLPVKSTDGNTTIKQLLVNIDTQITTTIEKPKEQILIPITNNLTESKQDSNDQVIQQESQVDQTDIRKRIKKGAFDRGESTNNFIGLISSQRVAMRRNRFRFRKENRNQNGDETEIFPENQETLDLLEKIRQGATGLAIGQSPVSQQVCIIQNILLNFFFSFFLQGCRFELPSDLKLLENLTPLEYLSKYCRLSSRRNYQFKRIFEKYRNNQFRCESSNLYTSITDIHSETFTRSQYDYLCQLINLGNEPHQFSFETFAGILALCERILYNSSQFRSSLDDHDLAKDTLEKCDFDSLDRKFDGLIISDTMKRLLRTI
jgi:hypothetical protein